MAAALAKEDSLTNISWGPLGCGEAQLPAQPTACEFYLRANVLQGVNSTEVRDRRVLHHSSCKRL